ncbi:MAG: hypothetical protein ACRC20_09645 [Segniliparus sp.]|uniref:hypothetical protein n=1 Tax=Segniliparus sp. TaxID=2804064 RepID=UPI003F3C203A
MIFSGEDDAIAQSHWLITHKWVRVEDGGLRRGEAAQKISQQRQEARQKALAERQSG